MPNRIGPSRWQEICERCLQSSPAFEAPNADAAAKMLLSAGWTHLHPADSYSQWWCPDCKGKPIEAPRKERKPPPVTR